MKDKWCQWLANILPKRIVYFAYIRLLAHATTGKYSHLRPDEVDWSDALKAWEEHGGGDGINHAPTPTG